MRELEFLPADYLQTRFQRRIRFIRSWLLLAMGMAMVLWSFQMGAWVRSARAELESLRGTDIAVEPEVEKVRHLRTEAHNRDQRLGLVRVLQPRIMANQVLMALAEALPTAVRLDEVSLDAAVKSPAGRMRVHLAGAAQSDAAVNQVLRAVEASPVFERAVLLESKAVRPPEATRNSSRGNEWSATLSATVRKVKSQLCFRPGGMLTEMVFGSTAKAAVSSDHSARPTRYSG